DRALRTDANLVGAGDLGARRDHRGADPARRLMAKLENSAAVLLAAGLSRRYGAVGKLVADFQGKPLARHAAETLCALPLARRIAVCRAGDDDLAAMLSGLGFTVVRNPDTARGMASSLALGVEAAG